MGIQNIIKKLHFHPKHPENHNVRITNKKLPYALVWNDNIWETRQKKEIIEDLVDKGYTILDDNFTENDDNKLYKQFQGVFEDDTNSIKNNIEKETEILLINETKKITQDSSLDLLLKD